MRVEVQSRTVLLDSSSGRNRYCIDSVIGCAFPTFCMLQDLLLLVLTTPHFFLLHLNASFVPHRRCTTLPDS